MNLLLHLTLYITETQFFISASQHRESNARTYARILTQLLSHTLTRIAVTCRGDLCKIFESHSQFEGKTKIIDKFQI